MESGRKNAKVKFVKYYVHLAEKFNKSMPKFTYHTMIVYSECKGWNDSGKEMFTSNKRLADKYDISVGKVQKEIDKLVDAGILSSKTNWDSNGHKHRALNIIKDIKDFEVDEFWVPVYEDKNTIQDFIISFVERTTAFNGECWCSIKGLTNMLGYSKPYMQSIIDELVEDGVIIPIMDEKNNNMLIGLELARPIELSEYEL